MDVLDEGEEGADEAGLVEEEVEPNLEGEEMVPFDAPGFDDEEELPFLSA